MRHVWSILLALVLAPTVWLLCGAGDGGDLIGKASTADSLHALTGLALLLSAGSAYAILVLLPVSPAGPTLAGLGYLGLGLWALAAPKSYAAVLTSADLARPGYGLALLLAVPLIGTALMMRRWEQPRAEITQSWPAPMPVPVRRDTPRPTNSRSRDFDDARLFFVTAPVDPYGQTPPTGEETTVIAAPELVAAEERSAYLVPELVTTEEAEPTTVIGRVGGEEETTEAVTGDLVGELSTAEVGRREPGEKTQVIARDPGETTRVIRPAEGIYPPPGETTRSIEPTVAEEPTTQLVAPPEPEAGGRAAEEPETRELGAEEPGTVELDAGTAELEPETAELEPETAELEPETAELEPETRGLGGGVGGVVRVSVQSMELAPDEAKTVAVTLPAPRRSPEGVNNTTEAP